jgi:hypothetical protein
VPPNKAVESMEMHKVPPTWLGLDVCGPAVCGSLKFVSHEKYGHKILESLYLLDSYEPTCT